MKMLKRIEMGSNSYRCAVYSLRNRSTGDPGDHAEDTGVSDRYRTDRGRAGLHGAICSEMPERTIIIMSLYSVFSGIVVRSSSPVQGRDRHLPDSLYSGNTGTVQRMQQAAGCH